MSWKYNKECGPNAIEHYDDFYQYSKSRRHYIDGSGEVKKCFAGGYSDYTAEYSIDSGITKLSDGCLSNSHIVSISLPSTLTIIGDRCFKTSKIQGITLPDSLQKIGHNNFPSTLETLKIPQKIKDFPVDNVVECSKLYRITVAEGNKTYKEKDGILYNYDMTEILFCPNAKSGKVIIPNTVTRIGDYCFANCRSLDMIIIPTSVVEIGKHAFEYIKINKLNIRNSVKSIGDYCFRNAVISEEFKFSHQIENIPEGAFQSIDCKPTLNFLSHLEIIGNDAFYYAKNSSLPETITLSKVKELNNEAFLSVKGVLSFELFSELNKFGEDVFDDTNDNLVIRYYSYTPMRINEDAFGRLGSNATLVVPRGTKVIFQNASPWSSFTNIEEWETDEDKNEKGKFVKVEDEVYCKRLQSIAASKGKADRFYLKELLEEVLQEYLYVDSDEEYQAAMSLISYNRSFTPAIVPNLEKRLCAEWTNKYKLRIIDNSLLDSYASPIYIGEAEFVQSLPNPELDALPFPEAVEIAPALSSETCSSVVSYFNEEIQKQLQNYLSTARKTLKIAVSWFTNYSLFKQIKQMAEEGVKIQLIINNDLINNGGYCLNFNELIDKGVDLSLVEYPHLLHHKFVIIDDTILITGSYNWTRFSAKNYENMVVIRDEETIDLFNKEFEDLLSNAEHKSVEKMPEYVKERPEYDRSAFKQYITEELDAQARETSDEREKITALKKAVELNRKYLEKINPGVEERYKESFEVVDSKINIQNVILSTIQQVQTKQVQSTTGSSTQAKTSKVKSFQPSSTGKVLTRKQEEILEGIKASGLIMCLDVSGSMSDTYAKGHVHEIAKKALAASLAITDEKEVNIWTFGNDATYKGSFGIHQINEINKIACMNEGTYLQKFIQKANSYINDGALCIIFTDDDSSSISAAIEGIKNRKNVFWQIIAYERDVKSIKEHIRNVKNASVVSLVDYQSKKEEEISSMLLKDYIIWKSKVKSKK